MFCFKHHAENEAERLVPELFLLFLFFLDFQEVKAIGLQLSFNIFWYPSTWYALKTNWIRLLIQRYAQHWIFRKVSVYVSSPHFVYDFFLFIQKCLGSGIQATGWAKELSSVMTACRHGFHNGIMACMLQIGGSAIRRFFVAWVVF